ncbi:MAG: hypothetical protein GXX09_09090 [Syntrophomonadaceae bacterium]|nr:hypothetical protein [Syntrophomonadaceae bacterium]
MKLEKHELTLVGLLTFLFVAPPVLSGTIKSMDEIWVYQFARRILAGYIPYQDYSMLTLPFSAQLNTIFLRFLADELVVLRVVAILTTGATGLLLYTTCRKLEVNKGFSLLATLAFMYLFLQFPYNNYNWLAVGWLAGALFLETLLLRASESPGGEKPGSGPVLLGTGFLLGLATITKQTIGMYGLLASLAFSLVGVPGWKNAGLCTRWIALKLAGWLPVVGVELLYFWHSGAMGAFINETVAGPATFARESYVPYTSLLHLSWPVAALAVLVPILLLALLIGSLSPRQTANARSRYLLVFLYAAANYLVVFPMSCWVHLFLALPLSCAGLALLLGGIPQKYLSPPGGRLATRGAVLVVAVPLLLYTTVSFQWLLHPPHFSRLKHYQCIPMTPEKENRIRQVCSHIARLESAGRQVYILDHRAALYLIPLDRFATKYDSLLPGSFGSSRVQQELIAQISASPAPAVLLPIVPTGARLRVPNEAVAYVKAHLQHVENVDMFAVYVK